MRIFCKHFAHNVRRAPSSGRGLLLAVLSVFCLAPQMRALGTQPMVAIHDSELTRALESTVAAFPTPSGGGTTGFEWWPTNWHYFVMPESVNEALQSDGTASTVVSDDDVSAGLLLTDGVPTYPIVVSLASEAIRDDEIPEFTNYVAAGGFLLVGSSSFTRNTDGTSRGDFAFADELGVHMVSPGLTNWAANTTFTKQIDHRMISHIPSGVLTWAMPSAAEEVSWGVSPAHPYSPPHAIWQVQSTNAIVLAQGDNFPYLTIKAYGKGYFIYYAGMQPLVGHGGWAPGMYAYVTFRKAIEWAFESAKLPVAKLSPWPYQYDAAFMVRHDLEDYADEINGIETSAQFENSVGARGDYFFCTGTLRSDMASAYNTNSVVLSLRRAASNYNATIGPHNGGLRNPNNPPLTNVDFDYWHWGPDEALDANPPGYASGQAYALASVSSSFGDIESWLPGYSTNGLRAWVSPYFNATREGSLEMEAELGVKVTGDEKLTPFPHWTLSTLTSGKRFPFVTLPVSDWFIGSQVSQTTETGHTSASIHSLVDFYYQMGALINLYSHSLSSGQGAANLLVADYITYSLNASVHPRIWSANSKSLYGWWLQRSNAQVTAASSNDGNRWETILSVAGATDPDTAVEFVLPSLGSVSALEVLTNGIAATASGYRTNGQTLKVKVGVSVTNVVVSYLLIPKAQPDYYSVNTGTTLTVPAPGVLNNDTSDSGSTGLTATLVSGPTGGTFNLNPDGGFSYTPPTNFTGTTSFSYQADDGQTNSIATPVILSVMGPNILFADDFARPAGADPLVPWQVANGSSVISNGVLQSTSLLTNYGNAFVTNNWTNYSVQGRFQFPAGAFGGGLSGRLDPITGAHYAAWIYPEGSQGGSSVLKLVKYRTWTTWSGNTMQTVALPSVGTNPHTLKVVYLGNQIVVSYDGVQYINATDTNFDNRPAYLSGGISADMWTSPSPYTMLVDDIMVAPASAVPIANDDNYSLNAGSALSVPGPGVLVNDIGGIGGLSAVLVDPTANGILSLASSGGFSYTLTNGFVGTDSFTYRANNGTTSSGLATATITVLPTNAPPVANDDSFFAAMGTTTTVTGPGVLGNDTDADGNVLSAALVTGPDHGIFNLNSNGGFTYTPTNNFSGTDIFTYRANDGVTNSGTATVTITVGPSNHVPVASDDSYNFIAGTTLTSGAPGVLGNDTDADGDVLTAGLVSGPEHGLLTLNANGGFSYTPTDGFAGTDTFSYRANDGQTNSAVATVTLIDPVSELLFSDDFTRGTDPAPVAPWVVRVGNWSVSGGSLLGGTNTQSTYANIYLTNKWTNYSVQARMRFPATNVFGGALAGRLDPVTGGHYAAWIYPEGSPGASNILRLVKFQNWTSWGYFGTTFVPIQQVNLPGVGTNWHTVKLAFFTNQIAVYYDGNQVISAPDIEAPPYLSGGVNLDMWTDVVQYVMSVDDVVVSPLVLDDSYSLDANTNLNVAAPGVLGNDTEVYGTNLTAVLTVGPANGVLSLNPNGGFTYTPASNYFGLDSFSYQVIDGQTNLGAATVTITVNGSHNGPSLVVQPPRTIGELTTLIVTNTAIDSDIPTTVLTYSLIAPPAGAGIDTNGIITWTPTEAQGPTTNLITTVVTDNGLPPFSATNSFTVIVNELNSAPELPAQTNRTITELTILTVTNTASDSDIPLNVLTYQLVAPPAGLTITTNGVLTWTPSEAQGPSTNLITTIVTDNGVPPLSATNSFTVIVNDVNSAPVLSVQTDRTIAELTTLTITNTASDSDIPLNVLTYQLVAPPAGLTITTNGVLTWTPSEAQGPSTNLITTIVTDNGVPPLSATNSFTVIVNEVNSTPVLPAQTNRTINEVTLLTVTNTATDSDLPANLLTYQLV
ncbi:MAG: hypothetical protein JWR69_2033, partial [Pedosphaera sp.]|nr:hypothetical protein [Pedosphaera sp.]